MDNKNLKFENKSHIDSYHSQNIVRSDESIPSSIVSLLISSIVAVGIALLPILLTR